jgi:hypothetical protein
LTDSELTDSEVYNFFKICDWFSPVPLANPEDPDSPEDPADRATTLPTVHVRLAPALSAVVRSLVDTSIARLQPGRQPKNNLENAEKGIFLSKNDQIFGRNIIAYHNHSSFYFRLCFLLPNWLWNCCPKNVGRK